MEQSSPKSNKEQDKSIVSLLGQLTDFKSELSNQEEDKIEEINIQNGDYFEKYINQKLKYQLKSDKAFSSVIDVSEVHDDMILSLNYALIQDPKDPQLNPETAVKIIEIIDLVLKGETQIQIDSLLPLVEGKELFDFFNNIKEYSFPSDNKIDINKKYTVIVESTFCLQSQINIDELLVQAQSADPSQRKNGLNAIEKLSQSHLSSFLTELGKVLSDESKDPNIRILSAIIIKNTLLHTEVFRNKWKTELSNKEKNDIKLLVLSTLASSNKSIRTMASTVVASISKIDSPITETWPELLPSLTDNSFNQDINMKLSAIEALGYVCEELNPKSIDSSNVDKIMNALIQNLIKEQNNVQVILQLLKALYYAIRLAQKNFQNNNERRIIMEAIFQIETFKRIS